MMPSAYLDPARPVRVVFDDIAYGARLEVLECEGARVAIVLRRGLLAAVAPLAIEGARARQGLRVIFAELSQMTQLTPDAV